MRSRLRLVPAMLAVVLAGCGTSTQPAPPPEQTAVGGESAAGGSTVGDTPVDQRFPDVISAELTPTGGTSYDLAVTISSPYDTPDRYADGWRVLGPDGEELGAHTLGHDHASEQPFTRTQSGLQIPPDATEIVVEGRDLLNGYGGGRATVPVPAA